MFKKIAHVLLIVAVLSATGSHWLVLQGIAWSTMLVDRVHTESLSAALESTFDGHHPCCLCKKISEDRQKETKPEFTVQFKKAELTFEPVAIIFSAPSHFVLMDSPIFGHAELTYQPPVPPPRAAAA